VVPRRAAPAAGIFAPDWVQRRQGSSGNYLGPSEGRRWLVLFIELDPRASPEKAPPEDSEHHTLSDGTALHVTVWTQSLIETPNELLTAFHEAKIGASASTADVARPRGTTRVS